MDDLSPAAQAVLAAVTQNQYGLDPADVPNEAARFSGVIAAVLRAAADQVVPEESAPKGMQASVRQFTHQEWRRYQRQEIRAELLAIATELENAND
jgi:hypothetical protein